MSCRCILVILPQKGEVDVIAEVSLGSLLLTGVICIVVFVGLLIRLTRGRTASQSLEEKAQVVGEPGDSSLRNERRLDLQTSSDLTATKMAPGGDPPISMEKMYLSGPDHPEGPNHWQT